VANCPAKNLELGRKNPRIRDAGVLADELLAQPDLRALESQMKSLPGQRIAIIGHSFTMDLHWASPSAFVPHRDRDVRTGEHESRGSVVSGRRVDLVACLQEFLSGRFSLETRRCALSTNLSNPRDFADLRAMGLCHFLQTEKGH